MKQVNIHRAQAVFCALILLVAIQTTNGLALDLSSSEVIKVSGKVEVKKQQESSYVRLKSNLRLAGSRKMLDQGDRVKTHRKSGAEMIIKDTCVLALKENSLFEVPQSKGESAIAQIKAQDGSFLFKVVSGQPFSVQTADVIAGVKGTLFEVNILDGLELMMAFPGLELGQMQAGGTTVNVYEGQVDLNHPVTGARQQLRRGERIAVFNALLRGAHGSLAKGFSPIQRFDVLKKLRTRFGALGENLLSINSSRNGMLKGLLSMKPGRFSMPLQRANRLNQLQRHTPGGTP